MRITSYVLALYVCVFAAAPAAADCVNINTASVAELERIIHIGPERAQELVARRPFASVDDLVRISGIGPARLADIKAQGLASVSCIATPIPAPPPATTPSPIPPPSPGLVATTDRITIQIASREVLPDALRVSLATGEVFIVPASQLVYVRDEWPTWIDEDGDCQDARQEVLIAESRTPAVLDETGCRVASGWWIDPLSGEEFTDPGRLDVDHMVPLANAFRAGGWGWSRDTRTRYANYLSDSWHLNAVNASVNRSKGDRGPDQWRPPLRAAWCGYARDWMMIKQRWLLVITPSEQVAINEMLTSCSAQPASRH